jgi:hypothetical protein
MTFKTKTFYSNFKSQEKKLSKFTLFWAKRRKYSGNIAEKLLNFNLLFKS